jgi:hypothetical protein
MLFQLLCLHVQCVCLLMKTRAARNKKLVGVI